MTLWDLIASGRDGVPGDDDAGVASIPPAVTRLWPDFNNGFLDIFGDVSSFAYAFAGHSLFLELMSEMRRSNSRL